MSSYCPAPAHNGRAIFWLHFPDGLIESQNPGNLLLDNIEIDFSALEALIDTSCQIYQLIKIEKPDLVLGFARGGIPMIMSVIKRFTDGNDRYRDQKPFHIFPGLKWPQKTPDGLSTKDWFKQELIRLVTELKTPKLKIFAIDTTIRGDSPNLIWKCMKEAFKSKPNGTAIDLRIIAVVGMDNQKKPPKQSIAIGSYRGKEVRLCVPEEWTELAREGQFVFRGVPKKISTVTVCFNYFPVPSLWSEDNNNLIGFQLILEALQLRTIPLWAELIALLPGGGRFPKASMEPISKVFTDLLSGKDPRFLDGCRNEMKSFHLRDPKLQKAFEEMPGGIIQELRIDQAGNDQLVNEALVYPDLLPPVSLFGICKRSNSPKLVNKIIDSLVILDNDTRRQLAIYCVGYFSRTIPHLTPAGMDALPNKEDQLEYWLLSLRGAKKRRRKA